MKDKLRELAERVSQLREYITDAPEDYFGIGTDRSSGYIRNYPVRDNLLCMLDPIAAILDAEGDGGAASCESMRLLIAIREDDYLSDSSRHRIDTLRNTHPARSGVVSDEDVSVVAKMIADRVGNGMREKYEGLAKQIAEHFTRRTP